ncbi:D-galactoside/L-rhamnose binding SUEL lectin domain [Dillenia turbinata]|uniref:Beta-galactosidase n=1 Tax=Dillenia turbinata TaxID=194707 RepID=A0AAN8WDI8_9MAGN
MEIRKSLVLVLSFFYLCSSCFATEVTYDGRAIKINGERRILISGSIHYPRSTPDMWPDLIQKAKDGGLNTIETYVFWNAHEPLYRQYDFSGNLDLVKFIKAIQGAGLYAVLRIGPYVCAEWNFGGFPVWLHNMPGIKIRTSNDVYENEMKNFTTLIVDMMRKENLFAPQGGPIIIAQIENEYGNIMGDFGDGGKRYVKWCANLAQSFNLGIPWVMFKGWGDRDPHRTAEDVAFAVARFFQYSGTFQNYYMYHGGTNFGRTAGGPYISTSYDYDAPLDEYGNLNQPKWGHLKQLHEILLSMEKVLVHGDVTHHNYDNLLSASVYSYQGNRSCFFGNAEGDKEIDFDGKKYKVPGWSVTILPDCKTEAFNTAKVNVQTSKMVKKQGPSGLKWKWRAEHFQHVKPELEHTFEANQLLDQKFFNDTSDYVWYMTSLDVKEGDPYFGVDTVLRVKNCGHILHVFVNGKHIGTRFAQNGKFKFDFEENIILKEGENLITLLSGTVGLQNYGADLATKPNGISGPVELLANNEVALDLSRTKWTYKVGLMGEERKVYSDYRRKWHGNIPTHRMFVWYKTEFKAPSGKDPVVVDLQGLGKGHAWVNGHSIGRYWPTYLARKDGCGSCNYHGTYNPDKCVTNCGNPSQRWYHVPRSFLNKKKKNMLEFGGNPSQVNFQTVTIGNAYANAEEGKMLELHCQNGKNISEIKFASFGNPQGSYGSFSKGSCESSNALSVIQKACFGKERCTIDVSEASLGRTGCNSGVNTLAVETLC